MNKIAILGAGATGTFWGAVFAQKSHSVTLLGRDALISAYQDPQFKVLDHSGRVISFARDCLQVTTNPDAIGEADYLLVTTKCKDVESMVKLIAQFAKRDAVIVSLQNGVENGEALRAILPNRIVRGVMNFNVVWQGAIFQQAVSGELYLEKYDTAWGHQVAELFNSPHAAVNLHPDIQAVMYGKLLINLNSAVNALAGVPIADMLRQQGYRKMIAACIREALEVYQKAGIRYAQVGTTPMRLIPIGLMLPDWLFMLFAKKQLSIAANAYTSMWQDLQLGRPTEIEQLNGVILDLAGQHQVPVPMNQCFYQLIKEIEAAGKGSPNWTPEQLKVILKRIGGVHV